MIQRYGIVTAGWSQRRHDSAGSPNDHPRIDYHDLAARLPARLVDASVYDRLPYRAFARVDRASRFALGHALAAVRQLNGATIVLSMSEDIGVPLALLLGTRARVRRPRARHVLIAHSLLSPAKLRLYRALRVMPRFDRILLMDPDAPAAVAAAYGLPPERVQYLPNGVDRSFWRPDASVIVDPYRAFSMGRARRDYATLLSAVRDTPLALDLHAGSQWHVAYDRDLPAMPANVVVTTDREPYVDVRARVARSAFVVIALLPGAHPSAGSVTALEAMAMGKPVVLAAGDGRSNLVHEGQTGLVVPAGDVGALRSAVLRLAQDPDLAARMGARALAWVTEHADHDYRLRRLIAILHDVADTS